MLFARDLVAGQRLFRPAAAPAAPQVSVVLPTWNRCDRGSLGRAADSVLAQDFPDLELIVVDDGSTDGTRDFILRRQQSEPRLVYLRHEMNCGLPALRVNEGIELARGRWIAFQFDDDHWEAGALAALVAAARAAGEPAVAFGSSELRMPSGGTFVIPDAPVNLLTLSFANRLANNSVLVARELFERHGLYDCHLAMRRLCDWDVWLRLVRHAPFVPAGHLVSRVAVASDPTSLGASVPVDWPIARFVEAIPRDHLLVPSRWRDYELDGLRIGGVELPGALRERVQRLYVGPYREKVRHAFPQVAAAADPEVGAPPPVLVAMDSYYECYDLCLGHHDEQGWRRGAAKMYYQPVAQLGEDWTADAGTLLVVRTMTEPALRAQEQAIEAGRAVAYYLDDDLLNVHEYGPPFDSLAPGSERHRGLVEGLRRADVVMATNSFIAESVRPHNPRLVPHNPSVPESWLGADLRPRGAPVRIGVVSNPYRIEELGLIWDGLRRISNEMGERLVFEFWGPDVSALPALSSPVVSRAYTYSYPRFVAALRAAAFDVLLTPLLDRPRARLAKAPVQYYHAAVAGALGLFSDVPPYSAFPDGVTCLKVSGYHPDAWHAALREAVNMPSERFDGLRRAMVEHVRLAYTAEAQVHLHQAALQSAHFHAATRGRRAADGRPAVLYLQPSPSVRTPGAAAVARDYGVDAVEEPGPPSSAAAVLERVAPAVVHAAAPWPMVVEECAARGIALTCAPVPAPLPRAAYQRGLTRVLEAVAGAAAAPDRPRVVLRGPLAGEGGLVAAVEAVDLLRTRGCHVELEIWSAPEDAASALRCRRRLHELGLEERVRILRPFPGAVEETIAGADLLLHLASGEPAAEPLENARAAGTLVVSNGRWAVEDGATGVLFDGQAAEQVAAGLERALRLPAAVRARILCGAYRVARGGEAHPDRAAAALFALYGRALAALPPSRPAVTPPPPVPSPPAGRPVRERVRAAARGLGVYRPLSRLYWSRRRKRVLVAYEGYTTSVFLTWDHARPLLEAATGREWHLVPASRVTREDLYTYESVVVVRGISRDSLEVLRAARRFGCRTVYDTDDNLLLLDQAISDPDHPWRRVFGEARGEIEAMLRLADVVKVYTPAAVPSFQAYNRRVVAIPPYHIVEGDRPPPPAPGPALTVGFLGSLYKDEEFAPVVPAIRRLLDDRLPLHFQFFGFLPRALASRAEVSHLPWRSSYAEYRQTLSALQWDIGLAPLRDLEFHRGKTNNKYREYAAAGIAGVYSDAEVYRATVVPRRTGLLVPHESEQAWYEAIRELAADAALRETIRSAAFEDVKANYRVEDYVARVAALLEGPLPPPARG